LAQLLVRSNRNQIWNKSTRNCNARSMRRSNSYELENLLV
jgi:hypothetical protein